LPSLLVYCGIFKFHCDAFIVDFLNFIVMHDITIHCSVADSF